MSVRRWLWPPLSKAEWTRNLGWALVFTPPIMLAPLLLAVFYPSVILAEWDLFLLFFGLPWAAGLALLRYSHMLKHKPVEKPE